MTEHLNYQATVSDVLKSATKAFSGLKVMNINIFF